MNRNLVLDREGILQLKSALLSEVSSVVHGFGHRQQDFPSEGKGHWLRSQIELKQVHGNGICELKTIQQNAGEVDALWTSQVELPVAVRTADCVPLLFAHRSGEKVAAIHAGWRGTLSGIVVEFTNRVIPDRHQRKDWVVAVGPCIRPCCFEMGEEWILPFRNRFSQLDIGTWMPRHRFMDLQALHLHDLHRLGFECVEQIPFCTVCMRWRDLNLKTAKDQLDEFVFHSFRRERAQTRQFSFVMKKNQ